MQMPSDRTVGAICLGLAVMFVTWGGPLSNATGDASGKGSEVVAGGRTEDLAKASTSSTAPETTTSSSSTTSTTVKATTTTAKPATTTTMRTALAAPVDDQDLAQRVLVTAADLPGGFTPVGKPPPEGAGADGAFEKCLGADGPRLTAAVKAKARAGEYAKSGAGSVSSSSAVFDGAPSASLVLNRLDTAGARTCFEQLINERLARNPNLPPDAKGKLSSLDVGKIGEQATGFRFEVLLPADDIDDDAEGGEIPYMADFFFVRQGRVMALLEFGSLRKPFPTDDARGIASRVIARA
jgi:hypothetical protein